MAATLAGVCQVPLTSVLLLFELTRDYRIILPLMAAVGVSSWVASTLARNKKQQKNMYKEDELRQVGKISRVETPKPNDSSPIDRKYSDGIVDARESMQMNEGLCAIDNSLCVANNHPDEDKLLEEIMVADAMRTNFVAVTASMSIQETLSIMLARKEWCAFLVHDTNILEGLVTLSDIQQEATLFFRDADEKVSCAFI
jgi:CBS domain-containing protein